MRGRTRSAAVLGGTPPAQELIMVKPKFNQKATIRLSLYNNNSNIGMVPRIEM